MHHKIPKTYHGKRRIVDKNSRAILFHMAKIPESASPAERRGSLLEVRDAVEENLAIFEHLEKRGVKDPREHLMSVNGQNVIHSREALQGIMNEIKKSS